MAKKVEVIKEKSRLTITEALAEIKTIGKRIETKRAFIRQYAARQDLFRDPLEQDGGSRESIKREIQAINDLSERIVSLRNAIAMANAATTLTLEGTSRTISEWLTWRREVAPGLKIFYSSLASGIAQVREQARQKNVQVREKATEGSPTTDVIVNIDEAKLSKDIEKHELIMGDLDGQLSLLNATTFVEI